MPRWRLSARTPSVAAQCRTARSTSSSAPGGKTADTVMASDMVISGSSRQRKTNHGLHGWNGWEKSWVSFFPILFIRPIRGWFLEIRNIGKFFRLHEPMQVGRMKFFLLLYFHHLFQSVPHFSARMQRIRLLDGWIGDRRHLGGNVGEICNGRNRRRPWHPPSVLQEALHRAIEIQSMTGVDACAFVPLLGHLDESVIQISRLERS